MSAHFLKSLQIRDEHFVIPDGNHSRNLSIDYVLDLFILENLRVIQVC
jgi:hypothetical protein